MLTLTKMIKKMSKCLASGEIGSKTRNFWESKKTSQQKPKNCPKKTKQTKNQKNHKKKRNFAEIKRRKNNVKILHICELGSKRLGKAISIGTGHQRVGQCICTSLGPICRTHLSQSEARFAGSCWKMRSAKLCIGCGNTGGSVVAGLVRSATALRASWGQVPCCAGDRLRRSQSAVNQTEAKPLSPLRPFSNCEEPVVNNCQG